MNRLAGFLVAATLAACTMQAGAQDTVYLSSGPRGYVKLTGRILDYTGRDLMLQGADRSVRRYAAAQVARIETQYGPQQIEADRRFAAGQYEQALALYLPARQQEQRTWVRRQITAQMVRCYQALGRDDLAGEEFVGVLMASDPSTQYFDCIPLAWAPAQPSPALEQSARRWLARDDVPAAVLLGASHLLPTADGPVALARLKQLAASADVQIAQLALAQTWRMAVVTADRRQIESWARTVRQMPEPLQPGPYFVLGLASARQQLWERAALAFLRVAILYPEHRPAASRALLEAARALEKLNRPEQAERLYRELVTQYPETTAATEARTKMQGLAPSATAPARADEGTSDQRFLAGLRRLGLFELAETYCAGRLAEAELPPPERAEMVIQMAMVLVDRALNAPPDQREPLWRRAQEVTDELVRTQPDNPRLPTVRLQGALVLLARGELARQEAELTGGNPHLVDDARTWLRAAIRALGELNEQVQDEIRRIGQPGQPAAAGDAAGQLTPDQLVALQKNVQYQLARALRNQGESYPPQSADRASSLTEALQALNPLATLDPVNSLAWESRIDEIVCLRLVADYAAAQRKLDALLSLKPPPDILLRARAERLRLALAASRLADADAVLEEGRLCEGRDSADLDYAWLEACLAGWRAADKANDHARAEQWKSKVTELVASIKQAHGPYWARRAEMLAAGYVQSSPQQDNVAMQVWVAESAYRSGRFDDALAAYDRAAALAQQQGKTDQAFQLGYVAATIEHARNRDAEALARYRRLALAMPAQPKAAEAHLLAVHHAAQLAKDESAQAVAQYADLLAEHLKHWPGGPTADNVRWRLGRLEQLRRHWKEALDAYTHIGASYPEYQKVVESAAACYLGLLAELRAAGQPTKEPGTVAAAWFESVILGPDSRVPERWSPTARSAAETAARIWVNYVPDYARAESILTAALRGAGDAEPDWTSRMRGLLVFALAAQGRRAEAARELEAIAAGPTDALLEMIEGLAGLAAAASPEVRAELAALELHAVERLAPRRGELDAAGRKSLDRLRARALADAGRRGEAAPVYQSLAAAYLRDGDIQEEYAGFLSAADDQATLAAALEAWREVAAKSAPESPRWFRAKYQVALLHYRLGSPQQAEKIIKPMAILYPDLGGPELKPKFLALLDRCQGRG